MQLKSNRHLMDKIRVQAAVLAYVVAVGEDNPDLCDGGVGNPVTVGFSELEKTIQDMLADENNPNPVFIEDIQLRPALSKGDISVTIKLSSGSHLGLVINTAIAVF